MEGGAFSGSRISSERGDRGKSSITLSMSIGLEYHKSGHNYMDFSFLAINFRGKGRNSDIWQVIQVHSTEPVHN